MKSIWMSGSNDPLSGATTEYYYPYLACDSTWNATHDDRRQLISTPGVINTLHISLTNAPGGSDSWKFTLMKNGSATALTVTISGASTEGRDDTNDVTVAAGDYLSLECDPTFAAFSPLSTARWSMDFESTEDRTQPFMFGSSDNVGGGETNWPAGSGLWGNDIDPTVGRRLRMIRPGTFKNFYVLMSAPAGAGGSWDFILWRNILTADDIIQVVLDHPEVNDSNTSDTFPVVKDDEINVEATATSASAFPDIYYGVDLQLDDDSEFVVCSGSIDPLNPAATEYNWLAVTDGRWNATETARRILARPCTIYGLKVWFCQAPGGTASLELTVMVNGVASALTVTLGPSDTEKEDTTNYVDISGETDLLSFRCVPTGTVGSGVVLNAAWSFVVRPMSPGADSLKRMGVGI